MNEGCRVAMWSGPRNISTAMMYSFENRDDCYAIDEPFYAHYLLQTGVDPVSYTHLTLPPIYSV